MMDQLERVKDQCQKMEDTDIQGHISLLEKHHITMNDWQIDRNTAKVDFLQHLKSEFVGDLKVRNYLAKAPDADFSRQVRRTISIKEAG